MKKQWKQTKQPQHKQGVLYSLPLNNHIDYENNSLMDFLYTIFIIVYIFYKLHFVFFKVIYEYRKTCLFQKR